MDESSRRGQSEVIGVILVLALVILGGSLVFVLGAAAISDVQDGMSVERAEKALTQLDAKSAAVALQSSNVQSVSFGGNLPNDYQVNNGSGWMKITIQNQNTGTDETLLNETLGAVTYSSGNNILAYQGGGVWNKVKRTNASRMVSPPEFHFRNGTLTLPIINVSGQLAMSDRASVRRVETVSKFPSESQQNPLKDHLVSLTVQSEYYKGWGSYFEERTEGEVRYDHQNRTVTLFLVSPAGNVAITEGLAAYSTGDLNITGNAAPRCDAASSDSVKIDSYNSYGTTADYCDQYDNGTLSSDGNITYGGNIWFAGPGNSDVQGTLKSGDSITFKSNGWVVNGSIYYNNSCDNCNNKIIDDHGNEVKPVEGIPETRSPMDITIDFQMNGIRDNSDNSPNVTNNTIVDGPTTISAGTYYLENIERSSNVTFDVCGGDIRLAVEGNVKLNKGATLKVKEGCGTHRVLMYVNNSSSANTGERAFDMADGTHVLVPGDKAHQFRIFGKQNFTAEIGEKGGSDRPKYVGVIFAPTGGKSSATGEVLIRKARIFGGVVTGDTILDTGGSVHYDEALKRIQVLPKDAKIIKINYLHVTVNRLAVS